MEYSSDLRKVLVVDDEPLLRKGLIRLLSKINIQGVEAENGKTAIELLKNQAFHAVVCDIMMPELSGLECLAQAQSQNIHVPFVFLTGFGDEPRMLQAIRLGAMDFIAKPFDSNELENVIFRLLEIGARKLKIYNELSESSPQLLSLIEKEEKMISLLRVNNNKKRSVA